MFNIKYKSKHKGTKSVGGRWQKIEVSTLMSEINLFTAARIMKLILRCLKVNTELNDFKKIICLRKS